jgi:aminomethyltransferase
MKKTALYHKHIALGAKMVPFAGYEMPVQYSGVIDEHNAVRQSMGVFDVSHMGEFMVRGPQALALIQYATSNDASVLFDGKVQYSCLPNKTGGIVDDLLVYRVSAEEYLLVVNASNMEKDWNWLQELNKNFGAQMEDISEQTSLLAVQGPNVAAALQSLTSVDLKSMEYYTFKISDFAGKSNIIISATGYTGAGGFEIYCKNEDAEAIWDAIMQAGMSVDAKPAGLAARDTLRLEMGFCLYGNDINDETSPIEAGLSWITKFSKDFVNSATLKAQKENGPSKRLVAFELTDRGIPRHGYHVVNEAGDIIGEVTSGTMSPSTQKAIGLAYVPSGQHKEGSSILIDIRGKKLQGKIVKLPFYKN